MSTTSVQPVQLNNIQQSTDKQCRQEGLQDQKNRLFISLGTAAFVSLAVWLQMAFESKQLSSKVTFSMNATTLRVWTVILK